MADVDPYATAEDLQSRWRELTEAELARAEVLIQDASNMVASRNPKASAEICKAVVCEMVRRVMSVDRGGITSQSQTAGSFSESFNYSTSSGYGDLRIMPSEEKLLGIGSMRMGYVYPNEVYKA